jgi:hypothetical protein
MATKVEANISDFLFYVSDFIPTGSESEDSNAPNDINFEGLYEFVENLSGLKWNTPLYDPSQPSYNLSFNAAKTANSLAGFFTFNHKATGDYIGYDPSMTEVNNGTVNDSITGSYGTVDKFTVSFADSLVNKLDKNQEITSSQSTSSFNQLVTSSNNTLDDKNDDYVRTVNYNYSKGYIAKTNTYNIGYKYSDTYKSKDLNYTNTWSSTHTDSYENYTDSLKSNISYLNKNVESGNTLTANVAYNSISKNVNENFSSSVIFTSAAFKFVSAEYTLLLTFSGEIKTSMEEMSFNFKSFTLENSSLKIVSSGISASVVDTELATVFNGLEDITRSDDMEGSIGSAIIAFQGLNQGDNTITIKSSEGMEIHAGNGKDVVVGGIGDDIIIGGAGSDKLTGSKGLDVFRFELSDFFSEKDNGDSFFNKSVDVITDFNLKDGDFLDFGQMGQLSFYKTLNEAKADEAALFYVKGQIYYNIDTTGEKYIPTVIVTLTGSPAINSEGTSFDYPEIII